MHKADSVIEHITIDYPTRLSQANAIEAIEHMIRHKHEFSKDEVINLNFALTLVRKVRT